MQKKQLLNQQKLGYNIENTRYSPNKNRVLVPTIKISDSFTTIASKNQDMSQVSPFTPFSSRPVSQDDRYLYGSQRLISTPIQERISKKVSFHEANGSSVRYGSDVYQPNVSQDSAIRTTKRSNETILTNKRKYQEKLRNTILSFSNYSDHNQSTIDQTIVTPTPTDRELPRDRFKRKSLKMADQELIALDQKHPHEPGIFKRKHVKEVVEKIKNTMNKQDNVLIDDVLRALKNYSKDKKRYIYSLGLVNKSYIEPAPPYTSLYGSYVKTTVRKMALKLKDNLIKRNVYHMLLRRIEEQEPPLRPLLYSPLFDLDEFMREREISSITKYLKKEEENIWKNAILADQPHRENFIKTGGSKDVEAIYERLTCPRTGAEKKKMEEHFFTTEEILPSSVKRTKFAEAYIKSYNDRDSQRTITSTTNLLNSIKNRVGSTTPPQREALEKTIEETEQNLSSSKL